MTGLNRNTVNRYLPLIRHAVEHCERESPFSGEVELDESYFGARRKTIVFGIYKRNERVYTEVVPNCKKASIQTIIRGKVKMASTIHTDSFRSYDGIVHMGYRKHYRVRHDHDEFVCGSSHINGIEGLWGFAKTRLVKFCGMSRATFYLHRKECEFRFNHRDEDLYAILLKVSKKVITILVITLNY